MAFVEKVFMFDLRTFLMPFFMDSFRIAKVTDIPLRPLTGSDVAFGVGVSDSVFVVFPEAGLPKGR
jgi:hypothetical protein